MPKRRIDINISRVFIEQINGRISKSRGTNLQIDKICRFLHHCSTQGLHVREVGDVFCSNYYLNTRQIVN